MKLQDFFCQYLNLCFRAIKIGIKYTLGQIDPERKIGCTNQTFVYNLDFRKENNEK